MRAVVVAMTVPKMVLPKQDAGSVGSAEEQDDDDGNDKGEEKEKEKEKVCVDCGKSPCAFQVEVSNLVQFGIDREWLPQDFDTQVEMNQERVSEIS
jgi:hypothetical protein